MLTAATRGQLEVMKYLRSKDAPINEVTEVGSLLHAAAAGGHNEVLKYLIKEGESVDAQDHAHRM